MVQENSPIDVKILINNIDVTQFCLPDTNWGREWGRRISEGTIVAHKNIKQIIGLTDITGVGFLVEIFRSKNLNENETCVFRGFITKYNLNGNIVSLSIKDKLYRTIKKRVTTGFDRDINVEGGVISEIFKTLLIRFTDLDFDDTTVINTGGFLLLDKFECRQSELFERLDDLAELVNYQLYYNPANDKVHFEPKGFLVSEQTFVVGEEIVSVPNWEVNDSLTINSLTVEGATQEVQDTLFFNGDNTESQSFALDFVPTSVKVYVGSGSFDPGTGDKPSNNEVNLRVGGKRGSTSGSFDYDYDDDQQVKTVYFFDSERGDEPSYTPPTGTNNVEIQYSYDLPTPVSGKLQSSIDTYGLYEDTITKTDLKTVSDAEVYLTKHLEYFGVPFISDTVAISGVESITPGVLHLVIDEINDVERELLVTKTKSFYPYAPDEVTLGDEDLALETFEINVWDRVKRLEEKSSKSSDFLIQVFNFENIVVEYPLYGEVRRRNVAGETGIYGNPVFGLYGVAKYGSVAGSTFILGNTTYGVLGSGALGGQISEDVVVKKYPGNNIYREFFLTDEFLDLNLSSDYEWNVDDNELVINRGGVVVTKRISLNIPYTNYNLVFNDITKQENLLAEISSDDGENWFEISSLNTTTNFVGAVTAVKLRLTNIYEEEV